MTFLATKSCKHSIVLYARTLSSKRKLTPNTWVLSLGNPNSFLTHRAVFYAQHNLDFFDTSKPLGSTWKTQRENCPRLEQFITFFKQDTVTKSSNIAKRKHRKNQIWLPIEQYMLHTVLNRNIGFNHSDNSFGPVLYSLDLYLNNAKCICPIGRELTSTPKNPRI